MKRKFGDLFSRLAKAGLFIFLGIALCWRAFDYCTLNPSLLAPLLCVALALVLGMTGVTMAMRGSELDEPVAEID